MTALEAYILARAFTKQAVAGATKGAPCQIQSITPITGGNRITFAWETSEGETETDTLDVMDGTNGTDGTDGTDGVGISSITFKEKDADGNDVYTVTLTNTNTYDITCPIGPQGETGATGATGNGIASISKSGTAGLVDTYTITYTNGQTSTFTVTNGETPTVDSAMSDSSANPVENRVIDAQFKTKVNQTQLATVETSTTASKAYSANEYLVLGGVLYKVTANIAQGGTIVTEGAGKNVDLATVGGELSGLNSNLTSCNNYKRRSRRDISSDLTNLATAISEQDLEKYGYSIGDYFVSTGFTGSTGYTYVLADMDTFYGGYNNNAVVNTHHISLVVKTGANSKWAETNDTSGGYKNSTLHTYLSTTVLDNIKADMIHFFGGTTGLEHLVRYKLLWTTATSGAWEWSDNAEYISALSEPQVYGTNVWAIDGYQTGEAWKWLEVFHKFSFNQIFSNIWWWLRSICSASTACLANGGGDAGHHGASYSGGAVGLILFH